MNHYPADTVLRDARARYFAENDFGDGGYGARIVKVKLGPVTFPLLNTKSRVRSVRLHDVHHVVTGYATDLLGEGEIGAWEVGSGCADHFAAWFLNLNAMAMSLPLGPGRLLRALARGRRGGNLYAGEWEDTLLDETVGALRKRLAVAPYDTEPTTADRVAFAAWAAVAVAVLLCPPALLIGALLWACA